MARFIISMLVVACLPVPYRQSFLVGRFDGMQAGALNQVFATYWVPPDLAEMAQGLPRVSCKPPRHLRSIRRRE